MKKKTYKAVDPPPMTRAERLQIEFDRTSKPRLKTYVVSPEGILQAILFVLENTSYKVVNSDESEVLLKNNIGKGILLLIRNVR